MQELTELGCSGNLQQCLFFVCLFVVPVWGHNLGKCLPNLAIQFNFPGSRRRRSGSGIGIDRLTWNISVAAAAGRIVGGRPKMFKIFWLTPIYLFSKHNSLSPSIFCTCEGIGCTSKTCQRVALFRDDWGWWSRVSRMNWKCKKNIASIRHPNKTVGDVERLPPIKWVISYTTQRMTGRQAGRQTDSQGQILRRLVIQDLISTKENQGVGGCVCLLWIHC